MQSLLKPQPNDDRPKWTFRNVLSGVSVSAAFLVWAYEWIVFPAPDVRKELQVIGMALMVVSFVAKMRRRSAPR